MKLLRYLYIFREFVFITLLFMTIEQIVSDKRLANYINPGYNIFVYLALLILLTFAAFAIFLSSGRSINDKFSGLNRFLVFIILIIVMNLPHDNTLFYEHLQEEREFTLLADTADKTGRRSLGGISELNYDTIVLPGETPEGLSFKSDIFKIERDNFYLTAEDIFVNTDKYLNMKLEIRGFVYKSKKLKKDHYIIARLVMYCCAADAGITGLIFNAEKTGVIFKKDEWLELYGHLEMQNPGDNGKFENAPVLIVETYKKIPPESSPYVYPIN